MIDKENIDDITEYTGKYFKEIERLLRELEKDAVLQKTDLTKDWVNDLIKETFNEEYPPIYARLIKKYEGLLSFVRTNMYLMQKEIFLMVNLNRILSFT